MTTFEDANKALHIADTTLDIAEIRKIISDYKQSRGIDREKVAKIIQRLKAKDSFIALFNSKLNPGWTLIADATDEQIICNLNLTLLYLSEKMTVKGIKYLTEGDKNNADA